jgi:tetratricopeptide (TPR) repeat protein
VRPFTKHSVVICVLAAAGMTSGIGTFALAQSQLVKDLELCNGGAEISVDRQIDACTAIIDSGALSQQGLAIAHNTRGNAFLKRQEYGQAIRDYDDSIRLNPSYSKALNDRGVAYTRMQELDRAIGDFDEAIQLSPDYAIAFANRAQTYQRKGEFNLAVRDYAAAVRLQPQYEQKIKFQPQLEDDWKRLVEVVQNERCWTRTILGDLQAAVVDCTEALSLYPNSAAIFDSRGLTRLKLGQWDAAIADYGSALRIQPNLASALYGRGFAKLKKGDPQGHADVRSAIAVQADVAQTFARYGVR